MGWVGRRGDGLEAERPPGRGHGLALCARPHLDVAPVKVHPSDHAALRCHVCPVNHLLSVVKVQGDSVVEALGLGGEQRGDRRVRMWTAGEVSGGMALGSSAENGGCTG